MEDAPSDPLADSEAVYPVMDYRVELGIGLLGEAEVPYSETLVELTFKGGQKMVIRIDDLAAVHLGGLLVHHGYLSDQTNQEQGTDGTLSAFLKDMEEREDEDDGVS